MCQARARADVRPTGREATEWTPCQPQRVRTCDKVCRQGGPRDGLCAVAAVSRAVWHCLCTDRQAEGARVGLHT
jgi:hypothetical protein